MSSTDWSRVEVEVIVADYLSMLASELAGTPYNKTAHRRALKPLLQGRSDSSIEFKHANISAALLDAGFPYINGYKPLPNYQSLLAEVLAERLDKTPDLLTLAATDVDRPIVVPEVEDILAALTERPQPRPAPHKISEPSVPIIRLPTNYIEREARNRSLGNAGELFVLNFERARLIHAGKENLAAKIEHTAKVHGDHAGYDILSFEDSGVERLIEVKTTKYGVDTPFFVTRNEVATSERHASQYQLYRLFAFRQAPRLYTLPGAIGHTCRLSAATFLAAPK
ncbi:DUF3883 domain-containing protein [Curvibacter delicatus]|jgi:hypothetical protein|uniref:DUF3883 domain-containing protein n=1 Tax=Curvibacter delicatus TaxID=80879 RepID=UPI00082FF521|nr:DUF3883 domain-containing protein [Curvibacter delicatus]